MRTIIMLLPALLLLGAGCSQPDAYWYHPDRTLERAKADYCECREEARQKAADAVAEKYFDHLHAPTGPSGSYSPPRRTDRSDGELTSWGELYKQNAFDGCMKSRSYVQLQAHRVPSNVRTQNLPMGAVAGR